MKSNLKYFYLNKNTLSSTNQVKMKSPKIFTLIKTPCGRSKFNELSTKKDLASRIRLIWFVFFAVIQDFNLPNPDT